MKNDSKEYGDFAYYYDALMKDIDYKAWVDYILKVAEKFNVDYRDILEMACGTGSVSLELAQRGYNVTAFDISEDMLSVAADKAMEMGLHINLLQQDIRYIKINKEYGIILCLCDSINYVTEKEDLLNVFKWVYSHLKQNGLFIFDINSSYKLRNIIGENTFTYNEDDIVYIWDNYITEDDTVEFYLTFFVKDGRMYRRFDEIHVEKIYEVSDIINMLKDCGFEKILVKDNYTLEEASDASERINFIIQKS